MWETRAGHSPSNEFQRTGTRVCKQRRSKTKEEATKGKNKKKGSAGEKDDGATDEI